MSSDDVAGARSLYGTGGGTTDTAPTVTITSPASGATIPSGTAVNFSGSASDTPDGNVSSYLVWRSNIDGQIGLGASFSRTLTVGSHTITATATDSTGHATSATRSVTVTAPAPTNTAPTVSIASPVNGATVTAGTSMTFSGSATDTQDGDLTSALACGDPTSTDRSAPEAPFTKALTAGSHTITARSTDSGGLFGERSVAVTVTASSPAPVGVAPKLAARWFQGEGQSEGGPAPGAT